MSLRQERVQEAIKRAVGETIRRELPIAEAGLITVNEVRVAPDTKTASVYYSVLGNAQQKQKARDVLDDHRGIIQHSVAQAVVLRNTPVLRFLMDESIERGNRILKIIEEIEQQSDPKPDKQ